MEHDHLDQFTLWLLASYIQVYYVVVGIPHFGFQVTCNA